MKIRMLRHSRFRDQLFGRCREHFGHTIVYLARQRRQTRILYWPRHLRPRLDRTVRALCRANFERAKLTARRRWHAPWFDPYTMNASLMDWEFCTIAGGRGYVCLFGPRR